LSCFICVSGSSSTLPKESAKQASQKEAPSKSGGASSKGSDKKFSEFSFNLAKCVHCTVVFAYFL